MNAHEAMKQNFPSFLLLRFGWLFLAQPVCHICWLVSYMFHASFDTSLQFSLRGSARVPARAREFARSVSSSSLSRETLTAAQRA